MKSNYDLKHIAKLVTKECGGSAALARHLGIHRAAVFQWHKIPPSQLPKIEELLDGKIEAAEMRPDLFPQPLSPRHLLEKMERALTRLEKSPVLDKRDSDRLSKVACRVAKISRAKPK